jgi:hypothetical protein
MATGECNKRRGCEHIVANRANGSNFKRPKVAEQREDDESNPKPEVKVMHDSEAYVPRPAYNWATVLENLISVSANDRWRLDKVLFWKSMVFSRKGLNMEVNSTDVHEMVKGGTCTS